MKRLAVPLTAALAAIGMTVSLWLIFVNAPLQWGKNSNDTLNMSSLFFNQKIFYFHVAHAFMLFASVFVAGTCSIAFLKTRNARWDDIACAAVNVAVLFGAVVLVTGSIWAKPAWGTWWNWEPRLTMSLLLWLILVGYTLVRQFAGASADRVAAGMAIFGMVGVPFIYKMVGSDSHPASGANGVVATLGPGMKGAFWLSVVSFMCWFIALVVFRVQSIRAARELRELREAALDAGVLE
ncbi:MAG: cytochrome c biogenesis protein CcsA [Proteobacteria bacterium]|nr:cytochrome c biogenesis protein CcsA [Pseudomonadota bacterium]